MSTLGASRLDAKHEQILKALLKTGANKRCIDCDVQGPTYAVTSGFNVFVCTICSGHHRTFGHRVKGVSMSTFKPEEVKALQEGGNGRFSAYYLAKWQNSMLPRPTDRDTTRVLDWIQQIYMAKRFYGEPEGGYHPPSASTSTASEGREGPVVVKAMTEVLGSDTPKLNVGSRTASLERTTTGGGKASPAAAAKPAPQPNLLDVSSPKRPSAATSPAARAAPAAAGALWDPFGSSPTAAAPVQQASPTAAANAAWATFGDGSPKEAAAPAVLASAAAPHAAVGLPAGAPLPAAAGGWEAFGDTSAASAAPSAAAAAGPMPTAAATMRAEVSSPQPAVVQQQQPVAAAPAVRPEVPLDVFYPEFEQIRATGMLPTGQPVPPHLSRLYQVQHAAQHGVPPQPQQQQYGANAQASPQHAGTYYPPAGAVPHLQQRPGMLAIPGGQPTGYGVMPSPAAGAYSLPSPGASGGYMSSPSPQGYHHGAPSPAYSSASAYSPTPIASPAGSSLSGVAAMAGSNGTALFGAPAHAGGSLRSSTSSLPANDSGFGVTLAPRAESFSTADPFSSLAPNLRSALPTAASTPTPAPASMASRPVPFPAASAPPGGGFLGYDLTAPAAPKPKASGNPFG